MIKSQNLLMGALIAAISCLGQGLVVSTQAILYTVSGKVAVSGTVSGTFEFDGTDYTGWNLEVSGTLGGGVLDGVYSSGQGSFLVPNGPWADNNINIGVSQLAVAISGSEFNNPGQPQDFFEFLVLQFSDPLTASIPQSTTLVTGNTGISTGSYIRRTDYAPTGDPPANVTVQASIDNTESSVTAVPFETDVLPLVGATILFGGGMWLKRKRAEKSLAALEETQEIK